MVTEEKTPEAEATPVVAQAITPSVEELTSKAKQLEADLEAAKREAKSHQEYGRKQHEELEKQRGLDAKVSGLESRLQVQTEMIAALMDRGEEEGEETPAPKKRRSEEYLARIKQAPVANPQQEAFMKVAEEADGLIKSAGLDMEKSPELKEAYRKFRIGIASGFYIGDAQDGLEEIKKVVEAKKPTEVKTEAEKRVISEEEKRGIIQEYMEKEGLLKSDTGMPSGAGDGIPTDMAAFQKWIADIPQEEYEKKYASKVKQMMRDNKIK